MNADLPIAGPAVGCAMGQNARPLGGCWRRKYEDSALKTCGADEVNDVGLCAFHFAGLQAESAADMEREAA